MAIDSHIGCSKVMRILLAVLLFRLAACQLPEGIKDHDRNQNFASDYEIGLLFDDLYNGLGATPCFEAHTDDNPPPSHPVLVNLEKPCAVMRAYFANCSLGISLKQESQDPYVDRYPTEFQEQANEKQQQCYCGSDDYWIYNAGCNACLKYHGFPGGGSGWIPDGYIAQQSSAYCSAKPTLNFREFLNAFTPTQTLSPGPTSDTATLLDTATAASQTAVSAYFTAPSETPTFLSGTEAVTLSSYIETTFTQEQVPTATATMTNAAGRAYPMQPHWVMMGMGAVMAF